MKVAIDTEEWYPVYTVINNAELDPYFHSASQDFEISSDLYARYKIALEAWQSVQGELEVIFNTTMKAKRAKRLQT